MADKTITYKNKIVSASLIYDFYNRLNILRAQDGLSSLTIPSVKDDTTLTSQMASLYSAVLSTKNAVSFLKNVELSYSFSGISSGDIMFGPDSVSIVEHNIGQMENACKAFFSTNKSGYNGDANFTANHATNFGTNQNVFTNATHNVPFCASNNVPFFVVGNSGYCLGFNHGVTNNGSFQPNHGTGGSSTRGDCRRFSFFARKSNWGFCPNGFNGCDFVRNCTNYSGFFGSNFNGFFSANFNGFFSPNFTTNNVPVCSTVNSGHFSTVYETNNTANFSGVNSVCSVVWGAYTVEGINDL